jgi:hypothetical protein
MGPNAYLLLVLLGGALALWWASRIRMVPVASNGPTRWAKDATDWTEVRRLIGTLCGPCGPAQAPGCSLYTEYRAPTRKIAEDVRAYLHDDCTKWLEVEVREEAALWQIDVLTPTTIVTPEFCDQWVGEMRHICIHFGCQLHAFGAPRDGPGGTGLPLRR